MGGDHCRCGKALRTAPAVILLVLIAQLVAASIRRASQRADDLDRLNHEIERLYGEGKSAAALPLAERYVDLTRER